MNYQSEQVFSTLHQMKLQKLQSEVETLWQKLQNKCLIPVAPKSDTAESSL